MPPTIEIDDDVLELLKEEAEPFVDTPNSVLRRLLGLDTNGSATPRAMSAAVAAATPTSTHTPRERKRRARQKKTKARGTRAPRGVLLPETEYWDPILLYLDQQGGRAPSREVVEGVGQMLGDRLTEADRGTLDSGGIRWHSRVAFARLRMIEEGLLDGNAPRGTWAITDKGRKRVADKR